MDRVTVTSTRRTVYGPARVPFEVEDTPRVRQLIRAGVFTDLTPVPVRAPVPAAKKATKARPLTGQAAVRPGAEVLSLPPLDHEGDESP